MQTRYLYLLRFILALSDLVLVNLCFFVGFFLSNKFGTPIDESIYRQNILTCNLIWLLTTSLFRLYGEDTIQKIEFIYRATWKSIATHTFVFLLYLFFSNKADLPKSFILSFYGLLTTGFLLSRFTGTAFQDLLIKKFNIRKSVAVLGMNVGGLKLAAYLEQQSSVNFVGFLGEEGFFVDPNGKLLPAASEQLRKASRAGVKEVFVSLTPDRMADMSHLLREAEKQCVRLKFVPDLTTGHANFRIDHIGEFPIICVRKEPLEDIDNRFRKRCLDVIFSLGVIIFLFSWLYPILAILIKIQSPGPVIFKQLRSGRNNEPFWCYKFRSMKMNSDSGIKQATKNDDRITPIGRFMRRTSIDELPQFFNVLLGHMSVIGPRPHMLRHTELYRSLIDKYMIRQFLKPGISGWAQVNGFRGETKEQWLMEKRVEYDIWYMENWSTMLDVRIIFMTIINIFRGEKTAY